MSANTHPTWCARVLAPVIPIVLVSTVLAATAQAISGPQIQITSRTLCKEWPDLGKGAVTVMTEDYGFPFMLWSQAAGPYNSDGIYFNCEGSDCKIGDGLGGNTPATHLAAARLDYANHTSIVAVWSEQGNIYLNYCSDIADIYFSPMSYNPDAWTNTTRLDNDGYDLSIAPDVGVSREYAGSTSSKYAHVVWENSYPQPAKIYYRRITMGNNHQIMETTQPVNILPVQPAYDAHWPAVAVYKNKVVVLFTNLLGTCAEVYAIRSTDDGVTWGGPVLVSAADGYDSWVADIAVDAQGRFHAVWDDARTGSFSEIYYDWSDDGVVWHAEVPLSRCDSWKSQYPAIATQQDSIYVVWEDHGSAYDGYEVELARSPDRGSNWDWPPTTLSSLEDGANALAPDIACQDTGDRVGVVWTNQSGREDLCDVYYIRHPWRTGNCSSWEDHHAGTAGGGWTLQGVMGSVAFSDSSEGFDEPPSLALQASPAGGSLALAQSPSVPVSYTRPYTLIFYLRYVDFSRCLINFGHARLMLQSPSYEILYDPGTGSYGPLAGTPYQLESFVPPETWGRFEIDFDSEAHTFSVAVNGFAAGTGAYLASLSPEDQFFIADTPEPGSSAIVWLDDFYTYGLPWSFNDDFNDCDLQDWETHVATAGVDRFQPDPAVYHAAACGLSMVSQGEGYAYGLTPTLALDPAQDYAIDFWTMIPDANNHWFLVMDDGYVHVVIDYYTQLSTWDGSTVQHLANLNPGQWYHLRCEVHPDVGNYDVYVDGLLSGTANLASASYSGRLRMGDIHSGSYDHGACCWDEIEVTQGSAGASSVDAFGPIAPAGWNRGEARCWLSQNRPNPSWSQASLEYAIDQSGPVRLEVFDVTGARVATLVNANQEAGWHRARWDVGRLPAGIYFGRLGFGGETRTRRMIVGR